MDARLKQSVENFASAAAVGWRLRAIRDDLQLSQDQLAIALNVSRENYANFELGRTPIKVSHALTFCRVFMVSEKWLATGEGFRLAFMNLGDDPVTLAAVTRDDPFAQAFEKHLRSRYDELVETTDIGIQIPHLEDLHDATRLMDSYFSLWSCWIWGPKPRRGLVEALIETGNRYCIEHGDTADTVETMIQAHEDLEFPFCSRRVFQAFKERREKEGMKRKAAEGNPSVKSVAPAPASPERPRQTRAKRLNSPKQHEVESAVASQRKRGLKGAKN